LYRHYASFSYAHSQSHHYYRKEELPLIRFSKWLLSEALLFVKLTLFTVIVMVANYSLAALPLSPHVMQHVEWYHGHASWYGPGFFNRQRADGKRYGKDDIFVAHRIYPIGTMLHVINLKNWRSIDVVVRDRGPYGIFTPCRDIDLSARAAAVLDMQKDGIVPVLYQVVRR
jgi:rare lipoprotein A (peptidoglycan hydrolase)